MESRTKNVQSRKGIRLMQVSEIENIAKLEIECFPVPWTKSAFEQILASDNTYAVVYETDKIIGYGIALVSRKSLHIANLAVRSERREKGIGSIILLHFLDYAYKEGKQFVTLEVRVNNSAAIKLYRKFGFKRYNVRHWYYPDGEDALVMIKLVGKGRSS